MPMESVGGSGQASDSATPDGHHRDASLKLQCPHIGDLPGAARQDHRELFSAPSTGDVGLTKESEHDVGHRAKYLVTDFMTEAIVE